jgi:hypothetical protein
MGPRLDTVSAEDANRKLTEPLGCAVSTSLTFLVGLLMAGLILLFWDRNFSLFGYGSGSACANVPLNGLTETGSGSALAHMRPGVSASPGAQLMLCANRPTIGQRTLVTLTQAPAAVFYLAILVLLWQLLRTISKAGPFAVLVAGRLRFLGWFVLAGSLAVTTGESVAQSAFASSVVTDPVPIASNVVNGVINGLFLPVLIACGLLTLARVIRVGTRMSDDLAGTV